MLDDALSSILPSWLVKLDAPPSSRDPLGLAAHGQRHADELLPGLNVFTSRARYYTFLCWSIREAKKGDPKQHRDRVQRLERLLVLCEALRHGEDRACSYVGRRSGVALVKGERRDAGQWSLPTRILKSPGTSGALRLYRTSLENLGLIEEDELEPGLGLVLTRAGEQLATRYRVDEHVVRWALGETVTRQKRVETLERAGRRMCLSHAGKGEQTLLAACLFGGDGDGQRRLRTLRMVERLGLSGPSSPGDEQGDLTDDDADLEDEAGREAAAAAARLGNWSVLRAALAAAHGGAVAPLQIAGAYEVAALGLNGLFASALWAVVASGRLRAREWVQQVGGEAREGFHRGTAAAWAGRRPVVAVANDLLDVTPGAAWRRGGALSLELLLRATRDARMAAWLDGDRAESRPTLLDELLDWGRRADTKTAATLAHELVERLVDHHDDVSTRKGKARWVAREDDSLVVADPRPFGLGLHALRFPQLGRIVADLGGHVEVRDEA